MIVQQGVKDTPYDYKSLKAQYKCICKTHNIPDCKYFVQKALRKFGWRNERLRTDIADNYELYRDLSRLYIVKATTETTGLAKIWVADFETRVESNGFARVVGWCLINLITADTLTGDTITEFMATILKKRWFRSTIYFHNNTFDSSYILDEVLRNKPDNTTDFELFGDINHIRELKIMRNDTALCQIRDSIKLVAGSVNKIAKAMGLEKLTQNLENGYDFGETLNEKEVEYMIVDCIAVRRALLAYYVDQGRNPNKCVSLSRVAFDYMRQFVYDTLDTSDQYTHNQGPHKKDFLNHIYPLSSAIPFENALIWREAEIPWDRYHQLMELLSKRALEPYNIYIKRGNTIFAAELESEYVFVSQSLRGGVTTHGVGCAGIIHENLMHTDVLSEYPTAYGAKGYLPIGPPIEYWTVKSDKPMARDLNLLYIYHVMMEGHLKPGAFPCVVSGTRGIDEFKRAKGTTGCQWFRMDGYITSVDLDTWKLFYDLDIKILSYISYNSISSKAVNGKFLDVFGGIKAKYGKNDPNRDNAKSMLNNPWGNAAMMPQLDERTKPFLDEDNIVAQGIIHYDDPALLQIRRYIAIGCFITANARRILLGEGVHKLYQNGIKVIYTDTDSMFFPEIPMELLNQILEMNDGTNQLGAWDLEDGGQRVKWFASPCPKRYFYELESGEVVRKCGGVSANTLSTIPVDVWKENVGEDWTIVPGERLFYNKLSRTLHTPKPKLSSRILPGGRELVPSERRMSPVKQTQFIRGE